MKKYVYSYFLLAIIIFSSCSSDKEKRELVFVDPESIEIEYDEENKENEEYKYSQDDDNAVIVPFRNENGVKYVDVKVNGVGLEMIFDTGCYSTLISVAEANYLYQKGKLTQNDILGMSTAQIADGTLVENMVVNLKEVIINDQIYCLNVKATVVNNNNAQLLLGNEVLDRVATIEIDNENQIIKFKLK